MHGAIQLTPIGDCFPLVYKHGIAYDTMSKRAARQAACKHLSLRRKWAVVWVHVYLHGVAVVHPLAPVVSYDCAVPVSYRLSPRPSDMTIGYKNGCDGLLDSCDRGWRLSHVASISAPNAAPNAYVGFAICCSRPPKPHTHTYTHPAYGEKGKVPPHARMRWTSWVCVTASERVCGWYTPIHGTAYNCRLSVFELQSI